MEAKYSACNSDRAATEWQLNGDISKGGGGMANPETLSASVREFIDQMGLYFAGFDISRSAGHIVGVLMVTDRPLSLDEIASALQVSRASVSTNARLLASAGLAQPVSMPGDRRDRGDYTRVLPHFAHEASVTGLDESIPICVIHPPGTCFCPGSAQGPSPDGVREG